MMDHYEYDDYGDYYPYGKKKNGFGRGVITGVLGTLVAVFLAAAVIIAVRGIDQAGAAAAGGQGAPKGGAGSAAAGEASGLAEVTDKLEEIQGYIESNYLFDYDVCYHDTPVKNIEDLNHLALLAKRDLKKITCPLLVVKAGQDQSVHPDAPKWIILQSSSVEKKLLVLPNSPHVCTLGAERQLLFRKVAAFLRD